MNVENSDLLPPQDTDAEAQLLAAMLRNRDVAGVAVERLQPDDFYVGAHRRIFVVARKMVRQGQALDAAAVAEALIAEDATGVKGGWTAYLLRQTASGAPSTERCVELMARIRDRALARKLNAFATELSLKVFRTNAKAVDLLREAKAGLDKLA